jgi:hypothetical protein
LIGIGTEVGLAQLNLPSVRAKNSENQGEYQDLMNVKKQLIRREVDTSKRTIRGRSLCNLMGIGLVVGLAQGNIPSARSKNSENRWECHDLLDGMVEWSKQEVNTSKRAIWTWSMCNYKSRGLVVGLA